MTALETPMLNLGERALDVAAARQRAIAGNIANLDTPGYHTRDVDFGAELSRRIQGSSDSQSAIASRDVRGLIERPDGNNVNMDREGLLSAETQLKYAVAVQVVRSEFKRMQMAIEAQ